MRSDSLHVVTAIANPIRWGSRIKLYREFEQHMLDSGVKLTTVECAYGDRPHELAGNPHVNHIAVKARTLVWNKECLLNLGIQRLGADAQYIGTFDADIRFRRANWATETVQALQLYSVVQPWSDAYDLGPHDEHIQHHKSFGSVFHADRPVAPEGPNWWKFNGGPYDYPHSGYAWAWTRSILDKIGGLLEIGGMGSGDHHMALGLAGKAHKSMPAGTDPAYASHVHRWQDRAIEHVAGKVGYVPGTIEHAFHGRKADRKYVPRWEMFVEHAFNPNTDLKRNSYGVLEFAGNKPALERAFDRYLRSREEDVNTLS